MDSFNKPVFLKEDSTLEQRLELLKKSNYVDGENYYNIKMGVDGENQLAYHLKRTNIPMYVLRDIHLSIDGINTQIDFVVITSHHCYFIECKNYNAKTIKVDNNGNFKQNTKNKREYQGIKSPLSQANEQLELFKRIYMEEKHDFNEKNFDKYFKTMVIFANPEIILDTKEASSYIKYNVLKIDNFVKQIKYDEEHQKDVVLNEDQMLKLANYILYKNVDVKFDNIEIDEIKQEPYLDFEYLTDTAKSVVKQEINNTKNFLKDVLVLIICLIVFALFIFFILIPLLIEAISMMK